MNSKKVQMNFMIGFVLTSLWWVLNYVSIFNGSFDLWSVLSAGSGYNFYILHMTIFTLFICLKLTYQEEINAAYLVSHIGRNKYFQFQCKVLFRSSIEFSLIFISISILFTVISVSPALLLDVHYLFAVAYQLFLCILFYTLQGACFYIFELIFSTKSKAFIGIFVLQVILLALTRFFNIWLPINTFDFYDRIYLKTLSPDYIPFSLIKIVTVLLIILLAASMLVQKKDFLNEEL